MKNFSRFCCRAPRPTGATQGRTTANEDHRFVEGPRDVQCGSPAEIPLFFPPVGKTSRTEIAERPRATADLLFEIGRLGAGSAAHREHVHGIAAILDDTFTDVSHHSIYTQRNKILSEHVVDCRSSCLPSSTFFPLPNNP